MPRTTLTSRDGRPPAGASRAVDAPPRRRRQPRTPWGDWSKHPLATLLWMMLIAWALWTMPGSYSAWPGGAPTNPGGTSQVPWADIVRRGGIVMALAPGQLRPTDTPLGTAWYDYRMRPQVEMEQITVVGVRMADAAAARAAYVKYLAASGDRYWQRTAARLGGGDINGTAGVHWRRNGQLALGLWIGPLMLLRSLAWTLPYLATVANAAGGLSSDPVERERRRRRKALARGQCPGCGYSIEGLPERRCPECNEGWGRHELPGG